MTVVLGFVCLAIVAFAIAQPIYAAVTDGPTDRSDIKAAYEGLTGLAGPNAKVISIERAGLSIGRSRGAVYMRRYEIVVERTTGVRREITVDVPVGPFSDGTIVEVRS